MRDDITQRVYGKVGNETHQSFGCAQFLLTLPFKLDDLKPSVSFIWYCAPSLLVFGGRAAKAGAAASMGTAASRLRRVTGRTGTRDLCIVFVKGVDHQVSKNQNPKAANHKPNHKPNNKPTYPTQP